MTRPSPTVNAERPLTALDAIYGRRSVRSYTAQPLERSTVRALVDAAVQAPTAMHEQPWVFVVVQERQLLKWLSDHVKATWAEQAVPASMRHAPHATTLHAEFVERLSDPDFDVFYNAGTLIVVCARRTDPFVIADCWLAAENLMLAAYALGLGTCCIGAATATLNAPKAKMALGMPADVTAIAPIVVGVQAGSAAPVARKEPEIVSWR
jgi:nitroreductase